MVHNFVSYVVKEHCNEQLCELMFDQRNHHLCIHWHARFMVMLSGDCWASHYVRDPPTSGFRASASFYRTDKVHTTFARRRCNSSTELPPNSAER